MHNERIKARKGEENTGSHYIFTLKTYHYVPNPHEPNCFCLNIF